MVDTLPHIILHCKQFWVSFCVWRNRVAVLSSCLAFYGIQHSRSMGDVQERALRFVYEDYTESTDDVLLRKGNMIYYT